MTIPEIFLLALALSADAFSVGAAVGVAACERDQRLRLSLSFGLFQLAMPLAGALLGHLLLAYLQAVDHWIAFGLLAAIGLKMIVEAFREKEPNECRPGDPTRGWSLLGLSLATSIDAFGAGLGLSLVVSTGRLLLAAGIIGITCAAVTYSGMCAGGLLKRIAGRKVEAIGGVVLVALGVRMLWI